MKPTNQNRLALASEEWYDREIVINGWSVDWEKHSKGMGIPSEEVSAFREFIRGCTKLVPEAVALGEKLRGEIAGGRGQIYNQSEGPHPAIRLYGNHNERNAQYCLEVMWDGSIWIYRLEGEPDAQVFIGTLNLKKE